MRYDKSKRKFQFYKTKRCPWFPQGRCHRGDNCNWAHNLNELRPSVDLSKTKMCDSVLTCSDPQCRYAHSDEDLRSTSDYYKTSHCRFWIIGNCTAGEYCRHAHGAAEIRKPEALHRSQIVRPTEQTKELDVVADELSVDSESCLEANSVSPAKSKRLLLHPGDQRRKVADGKDSSIVLTGDQTPANIEAPALQLPAVEFDDVKLQDDVFVSPAATQNSASRRTLSQASRKTTGEFSTSSDVDCSIRAGGRANGCLATMPTIQFLGDIEGVGTSSANNLQNHLETQYPKSKFEFDTSVDHQGNTGAFGSDDAQRGFMERVIVGADDADEQKATILPQTGVIPGAHWPWAIPPANEPMTQTVIGSVAPNCPQRQRTLYFTLADCASRDEMNEAEPASSFPESNGMVPYPLYPLPTVPMWRDPRFLPMRSIPLMDLHAAEEARYED